LHAFVIILDDTTDLFKLQEPLLQRNKSFNPADDVIFYFSRLCVYQDRLNLAAMTKRMAGATTSNAPPFSDKEPFALRRPSRSSITAMALIPNKVPPHRTI
jgi:hypothetical protein